MIVCIVYCLLNGRTGSRRGPFLPEIYLKNFRTLTNVGHYNLNSEDWVRSRLSHAVSVVEKTALGQVSLSLTIPPVPHTDILFRFHRRYVIWVVASVVKYTSFSVHPFSFPAEEAFVLIRAFVPKSPSNISVETCIWLWRDSPCLISSWGDAVLHR